MNQTDTPIQSTLVVEELRMRFLPVRLGRHYLRGEGMFFDWARRLSPDYTGGHWLFFELSNGGFYVAPAAMQVPVTVSWHLNGYDGQMGVEAFGIVVTLFALSHMIELFSDNGHLIDAYHALRDFAASHPEMSAIFRAID
ncbi:TPA: antirestriction protein [Burkholderia cenocepacia]|nr:antirestriction protein [Burkholderia vietnamiensis]